MRSQKQSNKAPRPFKLKSDQRGWSGGHQHNAFQLPGTSLVRTVKTGVAKDEAGSAESRPLKTQEDAKVTPVSDMPVA